MFGWRSDKPWKEFRNGCLHDVSIPNLTISHSGSFIRKGALPYTFVWISWERFAWPNQIWLISDSLYYRIHTYIHTYIHTLHILGRYTYIYTFTNTKQVLEINWTFQCSKNDNIYTHTYIHTYVHRWEVCQRCGCPRDGWKNILTSPLNRTQWFKLLQA